MTGRLAGKVTVVTGAGSGIGRAAATLFAREGAAVAIVDLAGPAARQAAEEITGAGGTALAIGADVSDPALTLTVTVRVRFLAAQPSKATRAERVTRCPGGGGGLFGSLGVLGAGGALAGGGTACPGGAGAGRFGDGWNGVGGVGSGFVRGGSLAGGGRNGGPTKSTGSVTMPSITTW